MLGPQARLPPPETGAWDWQLEAACRHRGEALFVAPAGERPARRERRESQAKQICARCPVAQRCLEHALAVGEPHGIWGGLTPAERRFTTRH